MTQDIEIPFKDKPFPAYLSAADNQDSLSGKLPGVIVIHEVWGLNEHTRDVADRIAKLGYTVIAPDLLSQTGITEKINQGIMREIADPATKDEAQKKMREAMAPIHEPAFGIETVERLQACFDYLKNEQGAPKIGCVGFCFGGTYTFALAAAQDTLNAAVVFYGHPPKEEDIAKITSPLIAFYGEKDTNLTNGLAELQMAFQKNHREFEHYVYPDTGHAFFNDTNAMTYNKQAAEDSWAKTVEFLKRNLA